MIETNVLVVAGSIVDFWRGVDFLVARSKEPLKVNRSEASVELGNVRFKYIANPDQMRGWRDAQVEFWNGATARKDYSEFKEIAEIIEATQNKP